MEATTLAWVRRIPATGCLYLGNMHAARDADLLRRHRIGAVVCVASAGVSREHAGVAQLCVPVRDSWRDADALYAHFDHACGFIRDHLGDGSGVLVHCLAGASRSPTVVLAYLMKHEGLTLADAFAALHTAAPHACPNAAFWGALIKYELALRGSNSMGASPDELPPDVAALARNTTVR
eukprot:TRINITY_DN18483_c0_g1_i1.p2 TRINITY_DN18483_c0_g1~~TRINITY_DN18483_c0_g1_i1.p2  ORF type:complete len:186 (+),score=47.35 TRINITY_DN18483_c0_g1_i1:22-558(+)